MKAFYMPIALLTAFALGDGNAFACCKDDMTDSPGLHVREDGANAAVTGTVTALSDRAIVDGSSYLVIEMNGMKIHIVYNEGETDQCTFSQTLKIAQDIKPGMLITAYGPYQHFDEYDLIRTCASAESYIRAIPAN